MLPEKMYYLCSANNVIMCLFCDYGLIPYLGKHVTSNKLI